ncbi:hypothetical protein D9M69_425870 [compost metagenome]
MAETVLQVAEQQGAERGGDVDHEDQQQGVLGAEAHHLGGVDGRQGDHRGDAGLVAQGAGEKAQQVAVAAGLAQRPGQPHEGQPRALAGRAGLRHGAFAQEQEGRQAGDGEQRGGDQHAHRDELRRRLPLRLGMADVGQAGGQADQPAEIAERPAPAGHPPQRLAPRQFGKEGGDQVLAAAEAEVRQHHEQHRQRQAARPGQGQPGGAQHAADGGQQQQAFLAGVGVGVRAEQRRGENHQGVGQRQRAGPGQRAPARALRHHGDEVGVEHRGDHHSGVAGVGEVVHRPGPDFAACHSRGKAAGHGRFSDEGGWRVR